jgi:hypothetical protein
LRQVSRHDPITLYLAPLPQPDSKQAPTCLLLPILQPFLGEVYVELWMEFFTSLATID